MHMSFISSKTKVSTLHNLKGMHTKIERKLATAENLISCHFEFRGRFWRDLKGSRVCFSN